MSDDPPHPAHRSTPRRIAIGAGLLVLVLGAIALGTRALTTDPADPVGSLSPIVPTAATSSASERAATTTRPARTSPAPRPAPPARPTTGSSGAGDDRRDRIEDEREDRLDDRRDRIEDERDDSSGHGSGDHDEPDLDDD
jgi:hypothetical protein